MYICVNCGHTEEDHFNGWGECWQDDCLCQLYEPIEVEEFSPLELETDLLTFYKKSV